MEQGYYSGVLDLYYAKMSTEDTATAAPMYEQPDVLAKSIEVTVTPSYSEGKLFASNATVRSTKKIDRYDVAINVDKVPYDKQAIILGRNQDASGVQIVGGGNNPPNIALGFAATLDDNSRELWWLYKGTAAEPTKSAKTKTESIEYQTPTINLVFVRRIFDDSLAAIADTSNTGLADGVETGWFKKVYEPSDVGPVEPPELPVEE